MKDKKDERAILQNLEDAGCSKEMMQAFMQELREGQLREGLEKLSLHRRFLLEGIHREQKQIECLDYLVYCLEKEQKQNDIKKGGQR
ncbi:MAG: hypothetical protein HFE64_08555 [Lachnospiraceae bacterium]|jgi:hypothetical protein|nr:hypothetical protein [Lachnospiraceae bacterium]